MDPALSPGIRSRLYPPTYAHNVKSLTRSLDCAKPFTYLPPNLAITLEGRSYHPYSFDEGTEALRGHVVMVGKTGIQTQFLFHPKPADYAIGMISVTVFFIQHYSIDLSPMCLCSLPNYCLKWERKIP